MDRVEEILSPKKRRRLFVIIVHVFITMYFKGSLKEANISGVTFVEKKWKDLVKRTFGLLLFLPYLIIYWMENVTTTLQIKKESELKGNGSYTKLSLAKLYYFKNLSNVKL